MMVATAIVEALIVGRLERCIVLTPCHAVGTARALPLHALWPTLLLGLPQKPARAADGDGPDGQRHDEKNYKRPPDHAHQPWPEAAALVPPLGAPALLRQRAAAAARCAQRRTIIMMAAA